MCLDVSSVLRLQAKKIYIVSITEWDFRKSPDRRLKIQC